MCKQLRILKICLAIIFTLSATIIHAEDWEETTPLNVPRTGAAAVALNGSIYVIGGKTYGPTISEYTVLNTMERYDPQNRNWEPMADFQNARYDAAAVVYNGEIYLLGGTDGKEGLDSVEKYDPVQNQWSAVQVMRRKRQGHAAVLFNGYICVLGGLVSDNYENEMEWFNQYNGEWSDYDSTLAYPRAAAFIASTGHNIYLFGGNYWTPSSLGYKSDSLFNWSELPALQVPRYYGGIARLDDRLYLIGGNTTMEEGTSLVEIYNITTNSMYPGPQLEVPRAGLAAVSLNDAIYAIGGEQGREPTDYRILSSVEVYYPGATTAIDEPKGNLPAGYLTVSGYPNPFNGIIQLQINAPAAGSYQLRVFDVTGRLVRTIHSGYLTSGQHRFQWSGADQSGNPVSSGIYIAVAENNHERQNLKIIYVK